MTQQANQSTSYLEYKDVKLTQSQFLMTRARKVKQMTAKMHLKRYMNEPPFSHKLNPLQGLFLKIDGVVNVPQLQKLFLKGIMTVQLFKKQIQLNLKEVSFKECTHFYNPLQIYLSMKKLQPSMFQQKNWEDIFFDTFDNHP